MSQPRVMVKEGNENTNIYDVIAQWINGEIPDNYRAASVEEERATLSLPMEDGFVMNSMIHNRAESEARDAYVAMMEQVFEDRDVDRDAELENDEFGDR